MKETTIVLNTMESVCGEILERTRSHLICKNESGQIRGEFISWSIEESAVKLTFTGLRAFSKFQILYDTPGCETREEMRKANSAGVFEFKILIGAGGRAIIEEIP